MRNSTLIDLSDELVKAKSRSALPSDFVMRAQKKSEQSFVKRARNLITKRV